VDQELSDAEITKAVARALADEQSRTKQALKDQEARFSAEIHTLTAKVADLLNEAADGTAAMAQAAEDAQAQVLEIEARMMRDMESALEVETANINREAERQVQVGTLIRYNFLYFFPLLVLNILFVVYSATNSFLFHPFNLEWTFSLCVLKYYNKQ
jgi:hypothetical protein